MMPDDPPSSSADESIASVHTRPPCDEQSLEATLSELACFVQTPTRLRILNHLQKSPQTPTELDDVLNIHRSTLRRNLTLLRENQYIRTAPTETVYRLTPPGQLFLDMFQQVIPLTRTTQRLSTFCAQYPGELPVDSACLRDCHITPMTSSNPHAPQERLHALLTASETVQLVVPSLSPTHLQTIAASLADWSTVELISPPAVIERLDDMCPSLTETVGTTGGINVLVEPTSPSVGVGVLDETAVVIVYNENQRIHALLEAAREQSAINEWVYSQYKDYKQAATGIE
jgi:predicted transcriptional regulator